MDPRETMKPNLSLRTTVSVYLFELSKDWERRRKVNRDGCPYTIREGRVPSGSPTEKENPTFGNKPSSSN